ncbi:MAG: acyl carrier protein [Bacilli bacterium]|nr:acyl carrier protein [Bacilli bacterium]
MENEKIIGELIEMFSSVNEDPSFDYSKINEETLIFDDLGLNSIGVMYISLSIEEKYGFTISNEMMSNIKTVGDLVNLILNNKK